MGWLNNILDFFRGFFSSGTSVVEEELKEMENAFAVILLGALVGIPSPPSYISVKLLPHMEREILIMFSRSVPSEDILAHWFSTLEFG